MALNKLSDAAVKSAKPDPEKPDKPRKISDGAGIYLQVNPDGSKYFRFKYRFDGKEKLLALGVYPDTTLSLARKKRDEAKKKIAEGIDPAEHKKALKQISLTKHQNYFNQVFERWIAINKQWSEKYTEDVKSRANLHILPFVGNITIAEKHGNGA